MKNLTVLIVTTFLLSNCLFAQSPQSFQYQSVVRDVGGIPVINLPAYFQISIISGIPTGTVEYVERHTVVTNPYGIATLPVGGGSVQSGSFTGINWGVGDHFLKVEVNLDGGPGYNDMGTIKLLSVPYALHSKTSEDAFSGNYVDLAGVPTDVSSFNNDAGYITNPNDADSDPTNELQTMSITGNILSLSGSNNVSLSGYVDTLWKSNGTKIYNSNSGNVGVGINDPYGKMVVQGDAILTDSDPLFEVKDRTGATVFIVYPDSVRIYVGDDGSKTNKGAFAVSGRNTAKQPTHDFLMVRPDSTRIYTGDPASGFGVADFSGGNNAGYMKLTPENYFIGHQSGDANAGGLLNTFIGYQSGLNNTIGSNNAFLGYQTGFENEDGNNNLFLGFMSGYHNVSGNYNSFLGFQSGFNNSTGTGNTFLGSFSGTSNISGNDNTFVGFNAGFTNTNGFTNAFIGTLAGYSNTTGNSNVFLGPACGYKNEDGSINVFIGANAGYFNVGGTNNIFIGTEAGYSNVGNSITSEGCNNLFMGQSSGMYNTTGKYNVFMGWQSGFKNVSGVSNCFIGPQSGHENTTGAQNIFIGENAGYNNQTGNVNTFIGWNAGNQNTVGYNNIFIGKEAGFYNVGGTTDKGSYNIFIGDQSGWANSIGKQNTFIGYQAGYNNNQGNYNCAMGWHSGYGLTIGTSNVFMGVGSGENTSSGNSNSFLGADAGKINNIGGYNTFVGSSSGSSSTNTSNNTYIGWAAGASNNGSNNVFIGNRAGYNETVASNKLYIANSQTNTLIYGDFSTGSVGIGTTTPNDQLEVAGIVRAFGHRCRTGQAGAYSTHVFNMEWTGTAAQLWIDAVNVGNITLTSDRRLKENIVPLADDALSRLMKLRPVSFKYKKVSEVFTDSPVIYEGFIADEVQDVIPSAVNGEKNALTTEGTIQPQTLNLTPIISILTKAMQEQQKLIDQLMKDNIALKENSEQSNKNYLELKVEMEKMKALQASTK